MSTYQPEHSSVAARVIAYLKAMPEGATATNADLCHRLGVPEASFSGCLTASVNAGLVHRVSLNIDGCRNRVAWALGPRATAPAEPAAREQETTQEEDATMTLPPAPPDPVVEEIKSILDAQEVAAQAPAGFACALFNDGRLYLELGDETMTLQVENTRALLTYLERVAMP